MSKAIISELKSFLISNTRILCRDFNELDKLQSSLAIAGNFAIASYVKVVDQISKAADLMMPKIYTKKFPGKIIAYKDGALSVLEDRQNMLFADQQAGVGKYIFSPISGMVNFSRAIAMVSSSVGIKKNHDELCSHAVVYDFINDVFYSATAKEGSYRGDFKIKTSANYSLSNSSFAIESWMNLKNKLSNAETKKRITTLNTIMLSVPFVSYNNPELSLCYLAAGKLDAVVLCDLDQTLESAFLIAKEAGAVFVYEDGQEVKLDQIDSKSHAFVVVAANYKMAHSILAVLNK